MCSPSLFKLIMFLSCKVINIKIQLCAEHQFSLSHNKQLSKFLLNKAVSSLPPYDQKHKRKKKEKKTLTRFAFVVFRSPVILCPLVQVLGSNTWNENLNFCPQSASWWPSWLSWFARTRRTSQRSTSPALETRAQICAKEAEKNRQNIISSLLTLTKQQAGGGVVAELTLCRMRWAPL